MAKKYLTPTETAELLMVSPVTVRQWAQKGLLEAQTTAGGHRRFLLETVRVFAAGRGITIDDDQPSTMDVLIVDDDRQFNDMLRSFLTTLEPPLKVLQAFDGFDAGSKVSQHRPRIVLLDIMMPGMNGIDVCARIKADAATKHLTVIGMTGHYTPETKSRMLAAGAKLLLTKPFAMDELLRAMPGVSTPLASDAP